MIAAVINEPRKMSGSELQTREQRAKALAGAFVKFISEHTDLLVQVRQDFLDKEKHEAIMGCKTWTEYCVGVLHYSENHIAKLLVGRNPAATKHDGSKNRAYPQQPAVRPPENAPVDDVLVDDEWEREREFLERKFHQQKPFIIKQGAGVRVTLTFASISEAKKFAEGYK